MDRRSSRSLILLGFVMWLTACGGDDGAPDPELSVEEKCHMLADLACDRYAACGEDFESNDDEQDFIEDCVDDSRIRLQCDSATSVSKDYEECVDSIPSAECTDNGSFESPDACEAVIIKD